MKNSHVLFPILIVICIGIFSVPVSGQTDDEIPPWVKGIASYWVEDNIDDDEFASALEFLIQEGIIVIESVTINEVDETIVPKIMVIEESVAVQNLNNRIEELETKIDGIEKSKDDLEEEFMQKESENSEYHLQELKNTRLQLTEDYENKINIIIDDTDADMEEHLDSYRQLGEKHDSLWGEYMKLYNNISEVRENTNPSDFE